MRAATIGSLAVLALSTAAITGVDAEGQHTRHRPGDAASNSMNSTDMTTNASVPSNLTISLPNAPGGSAVNNAM